MEGGGAGSASSAPAKLVVWVCGNFRNGHSYLFVWHFNFRGKSLFWRAALISSMYWKHCTRTGGHHFSMHLHTLIFICTCEWNVCCVVPFNLLALMVQVMCVPGRRRDKRMQTNPVIRQPTRWKGFQRKVTQLVDCRDSLLGSSAHVAPSKLTHTTV